MLVVSSENGGIGLPAAMAALRDGGSAVDAVEAGIRCVESNAADHSVGVGGLPNLLGVVEVDASIMEGATLRTGAVAAVRGYEHPISIARQVMERLPYVLLVGEGAEIFAAECGFVRTRLETDECLAMWREQLQRILSADQYLKLVRREGLIEATHALVEEIKRGHGTTNLIAVDAQGHIAAGVSTSGLGLKYPGRVGDSPIIGAGNYADDRYGAATCTGYGEMAIRAATARSLVLYMKMGMPLAEAGHEAMRDLRHVSIPWPRGMNLIAIDKEGHHWGASSREGSVYMYMTEDMAEPARAPRVYVPLES